MRLIYVDEAGTSDNERFRVVVGIDISSDVVWFRCRENMQILFEQCVPREYRFNFVFHAKDVFGGGKSINRKVWGREDRFAFFERFLAIPRQCGAGIAIGIAENGGYDEVLNELNGCMTGSEFEHSMALISMLEAVDRQIRKSGSREVATVICEQNSHRHSLLKAAVQVGRTVNMNMAPGDFIKEGEIHPEDFHVSTNSIIDCVHFAEKTDAPLMQLADAGAFAVRRAMNAMSQGDILIKALTGTSDISLWRNGSTCYIKAQ